MSIRLTAKEFYKLFEFKEITQELIGKKINNLVDFMKEMKGMIQKGEWSKFDFDKRGDKK